MKRVLIIGYPTPWRRGASFRLPGLLKYLPDFGWQPTIITPFLPEKLFPQCRVIETPYRDVRGLWKKRLGIKTDDLARPELKKRLGISSEKSFIDSFIDSLISFWTSIIEFPDSEKGWEPFAIEAGDRLLQKEHVDAIISCMPVTSYIVASRLKAKYGIPWVADLTDLWSQNSNYPFVPLRKLADRQLELKTFSKVDALVTASQPFAERLGRLHKRKAVYMITHGFNSEEVNIPPAKLTSKFTITYTGSIYSGRQVPSKLFSALRDLVLSGAMNPNDVEVRFFGRQQSWLEKEIKDYGLEVEVKYCGNVPREVAVQRQRESQLLLLLDWDDPKEKGAYTGKIFEYLGARRPILATGGSSDNVVALLLKETKAGRHAPTVEDIKDTLRQLYQEYKTKGAVSFAGEEAKINRYSHREMARKFARVLDRLSE